ncbi:MULTISPECIES: hypothetical protein [Salinibaculum]|uniref:hypothetical protein n=1 Tax=Salinibaculum TaxID=2732368 RepID=UPI0030CF8046
MGSEQFSQAVRGSGGVPIATNTNGTVETDNYSEGGVFAAGGNSGNAYPLEVNPAETIQEIIVTQVGDAIVADYTTVSGTTLTDVPLNGRTLTQDTLELDSITLKDPDGTGALTEGWWIGE